MLTSNVLTQRLQGPTIATRRRSLISQNTVSIRKQVWGLCFAHEAREREKSSECTMTKGMSTRCEESTIEGLGLSSAKRERTTQRERHIPSRRSNDQSSAVTDIQPIEMTSRNRVRVEGRYEAWRFARPGRTSSEINARRRKGKKRT
jgi:hypothetical protein